MGHKYKRDEEGNLIFWDPFVDVVKHPKGDEYYHKYRSFLWWCAKRAVKVFGGVGEDYIGFLYIRMHHCLKYYDPTQTEFTTYFCSGLMRDIRKYVVKKSSESWNLILSPESPYHSDVVVYDTEQLGKIFYRIPERDANWVDEILKCFNTKQDLLRFIFYGLSRRQSDIVRWYYCDGEGMSSIARRWGISKQRGYQVLYASMDKIRFRIANLDGWVKLYKIRSNDPFFRPKVKIKKKGFNGPSILEKEDGKLIPVD